VIVVQVIVNTAVSLIGTLRMDLFYFFCKPFVFGGPEARLSGNPLVVGGTGYMEQLAGHLDRISILIMAFLYGCVHMTLSYF